MPILKEVGTTLAIPRTIRPLELRQYRYFVALAEELHFARAAERLCIGQSNLSREIRALEDQIGVTLFYRTSRHTELTAAGERLLDHARRVLAAEEHARLAIGELKRSAKERLRIGLCERIACSRIATALSTWRQTHSDAELQIVSRSGRALVTEIEAGLLDAGITAMRVTEPGMVTNRLWTDPWVAALPNGHPLALERALELADLAHEPLAVLAPEPSDRCERQIFERLANRRFTALHRPAPHNGSRAHNLGRGRMRYRPPHRNPGRWRRTRERRPPAASPGTAAGRDPPLAQQCAALAPSLRADGVLAGEPGVIPLVVQPPRTLCNPRPPADARGANFCSWLKGLRDGWGGEILHCLAATPPCDLELRPLCIANAQLSRGQAAWISGARVRRRRADPVRRRTRRDRAPGYQGH